jgi:hypothetical protein
MHLYCMMLLGFDTYRVYYVGVNAIALSHYRPRQARRSIPGRWAKLKVNQGASLKRLTVYLLCMQTALIITTSFNLNGSPIRPCLIILCQAQKSFRNPCAYFLPHIPKAILSESRGRSVLFLVFGGGQQPECI